MLLAFGPWGPELVRLQQNHKQSPPTSLPSLPSCEAGAVAVAVAVKRSGGADGASGSPQ
jgi:hypothetical protein